MDKSNKRVSSDLDVVDSKSNKKKVSQNSSLSFQFCLETGPNEVLDSFDIESQQPSFGHVKSTILKTPQTQLQVDRNSLTDTKQPMIKLLFNTERTGLPIVLKTEESVNFDKNFIPEAEKEIFTNDSNSIKINKFEDIRDQVTVQIDGEMTLGSRKWSQPQDAIFAF